jgi:sulfatase maturation enzyme AslB (radical SAM superfamily)
MLTETCNKSCSYCFAQEHLQGDDPRWMREQTWIDYLDLLNRSGQREARLVGGEPTLHPEFSRFVDLARERDHKLVVFSNGLMPERALQALARLPESQCLVIMNCHEPVDRNRGELQRQREVIQALPQRVALGYNIHRLPFSMDFLLELYTELPLIDVLRVGLALPIVGGANVRLAPHQYPIAGAQLGRFARKATSIGLRLELDCGFVRCMFDVEASDALVANGASWGSHCAPILDVSDTGMVSHCFALGTTGETPLESKSSAELVQHFQQTLSGIRSAGIYPECADCRFRARGECTAGCLAHVKPRFRHTPFTFTVPASGAP